MGIDPGFAYNPGQARALALQSQTTGKLKSVNPGLADAARKDGLE